MRLLRLLIGAIVVFVLILGAGLLLVPGEQIARVAAEELSRRTGREVTVAGDARLSLWPQLGVTVGALQIANADWSDNGPLFQARSVTIGVDAAALLKKDIRIRALRAEGPQILLERNADGTGNWEIERPAGTATSATAPAAPAAPARALPAFTLDRAEITGAALYYIDRQTGTEISQRDIDLTLTYPQADGPVGIDLTLRPAGDPVHLTGTVSDATALAAGNVTGLKLDFTAPGATGSFDGRTSVRPEAQGELTLDVSDTARLARALRQSPPDLPAGLGRDLRLSGTVTLTKDGQLSLREGTLASGTNRATLAADLATAGDRPVLRAQVGAEALDLSALTTGDKAQATAAPTAGSGWSTAPIDASALGLIDGEIGLTAPEIDLGVTKLGPTRTVITIDRARAVADLREVSIFGGKVTGEFVANNRNGLSVGGTLNASNIALQRTLSELAGITRFTGDASATLKFLASGQSVAALMNALSGEGGIDTGRGTIEGIDLDRLFRGGDPTGGTTIFDATRATFTLDKGVLTNRDLLMKLAGIEARGEGAIGLGQQDIDYVFTPVSLQARNGQGLALPVVIRGPWAGPKIFVDVEKAIQLNAAGEKARLEEELRQKAADKLGIEQKTGESTEDALRRTIEEEAKKGLLKLFDR